MKLDFKEILLRSSTNRSNIVARISNTEKLFQTEFNRNENPSMYFQLKNVKTKIFCQLFGK